MGYASVVGKEIKYITDMIPIHHRCYSKIPITNDNTNLNQNLASPVKLPCMFLDIEEIREANSFIDFFARENVLLITVPPMSSLNKKTKKELLSSVVII